MNNAKERERIIFLHDIEGGLDNSEDKAKQISAAHPDLVIFSDPKPLSESQNLSELISNSDANIYNPNGTEFVMGSHIYKAGVKYSLVRGICPGRNTVSINDKVIELQLDKYGFLRLITYPINSGFFYVGPFNPLRYLINVDETSEYKVDNGNNNGYAIPFYDSVRLVMTEAYAEGDEAGFTKLFPIVGFNDNNGNVYNGELTEAYILLPKKWLSSLLISNDILYQEVSDDLSNVMDVLTTQINLDESDIRLIQDIIIDGVNYSLLKTNVKCNALRLYYSYNYNNEQ